MLKGNRKALLAEPRNVFPENVRLSSTNKIAKVTEIIYITEGALIKADHNCQHL